MCLVVVRDRLLLQQQDLLVHQDAPRHDALDSLLASRHVTPRRSRRDTDRARSRPLRTHKPQRKATSQRSAATTMAPLCVGSGITMGTNGLKWAGDDPNDDCVMLWTQTFGVTSTWRAVIASAVVFLLALLAQFLASYSGNRIQEAKEVARQQQQQQQRQYMSLGVFSTQFYDPEQGRAKTLSRNGSANGSANGGAHTSASTNGSRSNGHDQQQQQQQLQQSPFPHSASAVPATITSVSTTSRSIPAPPPAPVLVPSMSAKMAIPATTGVLHNGRRSTSASVSLPLSSVRPGDESVNNNSNNSNSSSAKVSDWEHLSDSLQHGLRIFIAYLLMLAAMTYDVALLVSIIGGFTLGYFVFAHDTSKVPASADPCCS